MKDLLNAINKLKNASIVNVKTSLVTSTPEKVSKSALQSPPSSSKGLRFSMPQNQQKQPGPPAEINSGMAQWLRDELVSIFDVALALPPPILFTRG